MMYPEAIEASIPEVAKLAELVKHQWPQLTEYESIQIALKMWVAHSLEPLHEIAVQINEHDGDNPLYVKMVSEDD